MYLGYDVDDTLQLAYLNQDSEAVIILFDKRSNKAYDGSILRNLVQFNLYDAIDAISTDNPDILQELNKDPYGWISIATKPRDSEGNIEQENFDRRTQLADQIIQLNKDIFTSEEWLKLQRLALDRGNTPLLELVYENLSEDLYLDLGQTIDQYTLMIINQANSVKYPDENVLSDITQTLIRFKEIRAQYEEEKKENE